MQPFERENEDGKLLLGHGAHPTPGPSRQAVPRGTGSEVLTSVTGTPGKDRALRQESGGQAAAKPGRGVPVNAAVTRPGSWGRGDAASPCSGRPRRALPGRQCGRSVPGAGGAERGAARSGAAGAAGEPGWRTAGRCPA